MLRGRQLFDGTDQALITLWDGKRWASVSTPQPGTRSTLSGISCPTSTRCYAVGSSADGTLRRTLVVRWNGTGWGLVASPTLHSRGDTVDQLNDIACTSAASCVAVGSAGAEFNGTPRAERDVQHALGRHAMDRPQDTEPGGTRRRRGSPGSPAEGSGDVRVLMIGGTGPSGVPIVRGLVEHCHDVAILHNGTHERPEAPVHAR
jgi:hypothetical protein